MMRRLLMFLSFCTLLSTANSQDIHFSQYYASPLTLNPALTGLHGGDFRAVVNYR
ncbi:MAG: type IX secretion system membrane protein PorP/SprF, partial [Bacteroidota bacterium]|nr:type IX secretion system membrane protein PorP/SprF [Bacteroidota bacterium]